MLPAPDPKALPSKGTRFVYDETGLLDAQIVSEGVTKQLEGAPDSGGHSDA